MADGNIAAMREALDDIIDKIDTWRSDGTIEHWQYSQLFDIADAALAAPVRNCDRFVRLDDISMHDSPIDSTLVIATREEMLKFIRWLMAPAKSSNKKEGGAK